MLRLLAQLFSVAKVVAHSDDYALCEGICLDSYKGIAFQCCFVVRIISHLTWGRLKNGKYTLYVVKFSREKRKAALVNVITIYSNILISYAN